MRVVDLHDVEPVRPGQACGLEPTLPVRRVELAQQALVQQLRRSRAARQRAPGRRAADHDQLAAQHPGGHGFGPGAVAPADARRHAVVQQVGRRVGVAQMQIDVRVARPPTAQAGRQPAGREKRRDADGQRLVFSALPQRPQRAGQHLEAARAVGAQPLPFGGELDTPVQAAQQRHAEIGFEVAHLVAERRRRDVQLLASACEARVPAHRLERAQLRQQRQMQFHRGPLYR